MRVSKIATSIIIVFTTSLFSQEINPLDYYPLREGKIWKYNGKFRNKKGLEKKYNYTVEVQGAEAVNGGISFTLFRSSYGSGPNDEPEQIDYVHRNIIDTTCSISILRDHMKEGDSWRSLSKTGVMQGKVTILRFNYTENIRGKFFKDCIKILIENHVYGFCEVIIFSKNIGPIKRERFQTLDDYKNSKPFSSDLIQF